jgi:hypothetical protein
MQFPYDPIGAQDCPLDQKAAHQAFSGLDQARVPLRRKCPAGTQSGGDIDEPVVTERSRSIGNHAASEIDAPGPQLAAAAASLRLNRTMGSLPLLRALFGPGG